jgi:hypothetical protein
LSAGGIVLFGLIELLERLFVPWGASPDLNVEMAKLR